MIYEIVFQYMPRDPAEPTDELVWTINATSTTDLPVLPLRGDIIDIDEVADNGKPLKFSGEVLSRHFVYERVEGGTKCLVIIIATETKRSAGSSWDPN
jgi:hypothetical protein